MQFQGPGLSRTKLITTAGLDTKTLAEVYCRNNTGSPGAAIERGVLSPQRQNPDISLRQIGLSAFFVPLVTYLLLLAGFLHRIVAGIG